MKIDIKPIDDSVKDDQYRGELMIHAPQKELTASTGTLANAVIRIGELEDRLKQLGLLKKQ